MSDLQPGDLRRLNWYGLKVPVARVLAQPLIGGAVRAVARTVLPTRVAHRLPVNLPAVRYRLDDGTEVKLRDPLRDIVAKDLYWGNGKPTEKPDRHVLSLLELHARTVGVFLDIGSYSGLFALVAARANPDLHAVAYDILPENRAAIERNAELNGLSDRLEARLVGLSDAPGAVVMPERAGTITSPTSLSIGSRFDSGVQVPLTTLDLEGYAEPFAAKIDVETYEWQVLAGGRTTIGRFRPLIISEVLPQFLSSAAVNDLLVPLGYRFFVALEAGWREAAAVAPDRVKRDWCFLPPGVAAP